MEKIYELIFSIGINEKLLDILNIYVLNNSIAIWLLSLTLFCVTYVLRYTLSKIIEGSLKSFTKKTKNDIDDRIIEIIEKPIRAIILVLAFYLSVSILNFSDEIDIFINHFLQSLIMILLAWLILRAISTFHSSILALSHHLHSEIAESLAKLLITIAKAVIIAITLVAVLSEWGFNVSGFIASLGLVGMAFALAAKDTASNLFGSMVIFSDRPFKIGDWIKTPEVEGTIEEIGMRSTKVRTFAQALVSVPNGVLANSAILNWSRMEKRRIKMTLGLTYDATSTQMETILKELRELLKNDEDIHQKTIFINFTDFNSSSLDIFCYFFTKTTNWGEYMLVRERINLAMMKIIENNGAAFAFPSQSLYVESLPKHEQNTLN